MALTAQEQAELDSLRQQMGSTSPAPQGGLSPQELAEYKALHQEVHGAAPSAPTADPRSSIQDYIDHPLVDGSGKVNDPGYEALGKSMRDSPITHALLKAMNTPVGLATTSLGAMSDKLGEYLGHGKGPGITSDDWKKAAMGEAPPLSEYLNRASERQDGPNSFMSQPLLGKFSPNDALGFAGAAAADPLIPAAQGLAKGGNKLYDSAFKKIDERLLEENMKPLSQVLRENGRPSGTTSAIGEKVGALKKSLMDTRSNQYTEANTLGAVVDPKRAAQGAEEMIGDMQARSPYADPKEFSDMRGYVDRGKNKFEFASHDDAGAYTPVARAPEAQSTSLDLPLQGQRFTPLEKLPESVQTVELPMPMKRRLDFAGQEVEVPQQAMPVQVRIPSGYNRSMPAQMSQESTGPIQFLDRPVDPNGPFNQSREFIKNGPTRTDLLSVPNASDVKSTLRDSVPSSGFGPNGVIKNNWHKLDKELASGYQKGIEEGANVVKPGLGDDIRATNQNLQSIIEAEDPLAMQVRRANSKNLISPVDTSIGAAEFASGHHTPLIAAAKKGGDLVNTTWFRTKAGNAMNSTGSVIDNYLGSPNGLAARELLLQSGFNPWAKVKRDEKK